MIRMTCGVSRIMLKLPPLTTLQSALEARVETLTTSVDNLQNKLQMGLEIETHLQKKVHELEKKKTLPEEKIKKDISELLMHHSQQRADIMNLLDEGYSELKSLSDLIGDKIKQLEVRGEQNSVSSIVRDIELPQSECRDVHVNCESGLDFSTEKSDPGLSTAVTVSIGDTTEALAQAMQEKVAALLLLSQQEEMHLLERNVNAALQKKVEELQRNLIQVTNEKVKALLELAELKQEYRLLHETTRQERKQGKHAPDMVKERTLEEKDGRFKSLLKRTYLRNWVVGTDEDANLHWNNEGKSIGRKSNYNMDFARIKIEYATLKESLGSMEHLTTSVRRLRTSLLKAKEFFVANSSTACLIEDLDRVIYEAELVKTALGTTLPVSWSSEASGSHVGSLEEDIGDTLTGPGYEKVDFVSAAGFEMVELLIFAAQLLKDSVSNKGEGHDDPKEKS